MSSAYDLAPDPASPVPLYHQIAESLRYRIATGAIPAGTLLPPLREAALLWSVNLHTARRAYAALAAAGIVATRPPAGTQVLPDAGPGREATDPRGSRADRAPGRRTGRRQDPRGTHEFARRVIREAAARHELDLPALITLLQSHRPAGSSIAGATVRVAECSDSQSADLARQLEARWRIRAIPWPTSREEPERPDPVVATFFHYNDLRVRWARRFNDIHFMTTRPDPWLRRRLATVSGPRSSGRRRTVIVVEREEVMLRSIAADVSRLLDPARFQVVARLSRRPATILDGIGSRTPVLVSPRVWGDLPPPLREDRRVHEVRYVFDDGELAALGRDLAWAPRKENG